VLAARCVGFTTVRKRQDDGRADRGRRGGQRRRSAALARGVVNVCCLGVYRVTAGHWTQSIERISGISCCPSRSLLRGIAELARPAAGLWTEKLIRDTHALAACFRDAVPRAGSALGAHPVLRFRN